METKLHYLEEDNHRGESLCCKSIQDMDCMKVDMRILYSKVWMAEKHALRKIKTLLYKER